MIQPLKEISAETRELSAYIADARKRRLPAEVGERARHHILDTLAAMVSGSRLAPGRAAIAYVKKLGGTREASVAGSRLLTSSVNAALANGMLAHADETDDSHAPSRNHPGCAVVPAALAKLAVAALVSQVEVVEKEAQTRSVAINRREAAVAVAPSLAGVAALLKPRAAEVAVA